MSSVGHRVIYYLWVIARVWFKDRHQVRAGAKARSTTAWQLLTVRSYILTRLTVAASPTSPGELLSITERYSTKLPDG